MFILMESGVKFRWYEPNKKRDLDNVCLQRNYPDACQKRNNRAGGWKGVIGFTDEFS